MPSKNKRCAGKNLQRLFLLSLVLAHSVSPISSLDETDNNEESPKRFTKGLKNFSYSSKKNFSEAEELHIQRNKLLKQKKNDFRISPMLQVNRKEAHAVDVPQDYFLRPIEG